MNLSQFKPFNYYSFYGDLIYDPTLENVTASQNKTLLYFITQYTSGQHWKFSNIKSELTTYSLSLYHADCDHC
jgi:hypothetical protein